MGIYLRENVLPLQDNYFRFSYYKDLQAKEDGIYIQVRNGWDASVGKVGSGRLSNSRVSVLF